MFCITHNQAFYIDGLVQDSSLHFTNALEIPQSCTKPSKYIIRNAMPLLQETYTR